jgi:protease II
MDGSLRWGATDDTLYLKMDAAHRPHQLMRRKIGSGEPDVLQENDDIFWMRMRSSLDGKYLFEASSKETTGALFGLHDPAAVLQCVAARRHSVLIPVAGQWWIESNVGGLKYGFVHPRCPTVRINGTASEKNPRSLDGVLFDGRTSRVAFRSLDYRSGRRCWWCSTICHQV